jgi:hypothetical protein
MIGLRATSASVRQGAGQALRACAGFVRGLVQLALSLVLLFMVLFLAAKIIASDLQRAGCACPSSFHSDPAPSTRPSPGGVRPPAGLPVCANPPPAGGSAGSSFHHARAGGGPAPVLRGIAE